MAIIFETLVGANEVDNDAALNQHRSFLDTAAKAHHSNYRCTEEHIEPYIPYTLANGERVEMPETDETKRFRVLSRTYEA